MNGIWLLLGVLVLAAQPDGKPTASAPAKKPLEPISLILEGEVDSDFAPTVGKLTALYYECYPKLLARFDHPEKPAIRKVKLVFRKNMRAPAAASGGQIAISVDWLKKNPGDIGLLTHELTHVVQHYPSPEPNWLTEGLADYARQLYGPKEAAGWSLPRKFTARQSYKDSYRTTARFLVWLEGKHPGAVDQLHRKMQDRTFEMGDFKTITGKTADELWAECVKEEQP